MAGALGPGLAFARNRRGASAVEFAFILPILLLLLIAMIDVGYLMMTKNDMVRVTHEAARKLALSQFTEQQAEDFVKKRLERLGKNLKVEAVLPDRDAGEVDVTVSVSMPMADAILIDLIGLDHMDAFKSKNMATQITMQQEQQ